MLIAYDGNFYEQPAAYGDNIGGWIAALYQSEGYRFPERLRGSFALALWDQREGRLFLAVDRLGAKALCYALMPVGIIFASQPSAIFASGRLQKAVNLSAITDYLEYTVVPRPKSAFQGVTRLRPGECVQWDVKGPSAQLYWEMRYPEDATASVADLSHQLLALMEDSVRITSQALDLRKAGCFLSGGTDSSSILGLITKLHGGPVKAFSIGFSEKRFNELEYARIAARHFGAKHIEGLLGADETFEVIPRIVEGFDEPCGNSSAIPTYWCAKLAHEEGVDVMFAGDGGDELFGGNERYRTNEIFRMYGRIPQPVRRYLIEPVVSRYAPHLGLFRRVNNYIGQAKTPHPERYCQWRLLQKFSPEVVLGAGMPFHNGHSDLLATIRAHYQSAPAKSELNRLLYVDVKMTLADDDLPKVTHTAELAGVNVHFPYLDHKLAEFTGRIPSFLKVRGFEKRFLFRLAARKLVPRAILHKKKHGFGLPIGFWLRQHPKLHRWSKDVLFDPRTYQRGYFQRAFVEELFKKMEQDDSPYFGDLLWVFLMLELWHRQHVEGNRC